MQMRWLARMVALVITGMLGSLGRPELLLAVQWTANLEVRAGAVDGPGALADVFHVELGPQNEIVVAQATVPIISVFDAQGRFMREFGRAGGGPGEFRAMGRIGWAGDTLWAMDVGGGRVHLFDADLQFVRTVTPQLSELPPGVTRIFPGPLMAGGAHLGIPFSRGASSEPVTLLREGERPTVIARISTEGRFVTLDFRSGPPMDVGHPWSDAPLWMNSPDGMSIIVVERPVASSAASSEFRVLRIGLSGDTLLRRSIAYTPRPMPQSERDSVVRALAGGIIRNPFQTGSRSEIESDIRRNVTAPPFRPPVDDLVVGRDGTIWLRRAPAAAAAEWLVLGPAGGELGVVRLPAGLRVFGADRQRVWGVVRDALDVPFVHVYSLHH
jgi:hypothetical protein